MSKRLGTMKWLDLPESERSAVLSAARWFAGELSVELLDVVVVGSFAYGKADEYSDVDLLLLSPTKGPLDRRRAWVQRFGLQRCEGLIRPVDIQGIGPAVGTIAFRDGESVAGYSTLHSEWIREYGDVRRLYGV